MKRDLKHKIANACGISILALGIGLSVAKPAIEITQMAMPHETAFAAKKKSTSSKKTDKTDKKTDEKTSKGGGDDDSGGGSGGSSGQGDSYSFYHLASSAATYFDASQNPDIGSVHFLDKKTMSRPQYFGNAGGFIGYEDTQYDKHSWIGAVTSALSSSAQGHSYNTYPNQTDGKVQGSTNDLYYYALFGHALEAMGLDSTAPQEGITSIFRWLFGIIMMIFYAAAISVPLMFAGVGWFLKIFNPFQFFARPFTKGTPAISAFSDPFANASSAANSAANAVNMWTGLGTLWQNVGKFVGGLYAAAQNAGLLVTVPACLFTAIVMLAMGRASRGRGVSMLKKVLIRGIIILMGVPIFADFYTAAVNQLSLGADTNIGANVVLGSTFEDFEDWAANTRLALPVGTKIAVTNLHAQPEGQLVASTSTNSKTTTDVRELSRKINSITGIGLLDDGTDQSNAANNIWEAKNNKGSQQTQREMQQKQLTAGFELLAKYISGSKYTAAQYETMYKSHLDATPRQTTETNQVGSKTVKGSKKSEDNSAREKILRGIKYLAADPGVFSSDKKAYFTPNQQPKDSKNGWVNFLWNAGTTGNGKDANSVGTDVKPGTEVIQAGSGSYDKDGIVDDAKDGTIMFKGNGKTHHPNDDNYNYGLSSLSLYNYLTTEFSDSTITVYSPNKISSMFVMKEHHSVNLVGTGINQVVYYLNALVLFIAITIIGWGYALATLMGVLSSELRGLLHMPIMLIGSLNASAKFFATVMVMIVQIFTTIFLYTIAINFLEVVNMGSSTLFSSAANKLGSGNKIGMIMFGAIKPMNVMGTLIYLIIATLLTLGMSIEALKVRGKFVRAMSEWIGDMIDKLLMTGTYGPQISNQYMTQNGGASQEIQNNMDTGDNLSQGFNDGLSTGGNNNTEGVDNNNANSNSTENNNSNGGGNGGSPAEAKNATGDDGGNPGGAKGFGSQGIPAEAANGDSEGTSTAEAKGDAAKGQANGGENHSNGPINESEINGNVGQNSAENANSDQAGQGESMNNSNSNANNSAKNLATNQGSPSTHATSQSANNNTNSMNHGLTNNAETQEENTEPRSNEGAAVNHDGTGSGSNSDNASGEAPEQSAINADSPNNEINQGDGDQNTNENNMADNNETAQNADNGVGNSAASGAMELGQEALKDSDKVANGAVNTAQNMGQDINPDNSVNNDNNVDNSQDNDSASSMVKNNPYNQQSTENTNNPYSKSDVHSMNAQQSHQNAENSNNQHGGVKNLNAQNSENHAGNISSANGNTNMHSVANETAQNNNSNNAPKSVNSLNNAKSNSPTTLNNSSTNQANSPKNVNSQNSNSKVSSVNGSKTMNNTGVHNNAGSRQSGVKNVNMTHAGVKNVQTSANTNKMNNVNSARGAQSTLNGSRATGISGARNAQSSVNGNRAGINNPVKGARMNSQMNTGARNLNQSAIKMPNGQTSRGKVARLPKQTAQNGQIHPMSAQTIRKAQVNAEKQSGVRQGMNKPYQYTPNRTFAKGLAQKAIGAGKIIAAPATLATTGSLRATAKSVNAGHDLMHKGNQNIASAQNMRQTAHASRETISNMVQQAQSNGNAVSHNTNNGRRAATSQSSVQGGPAKREAVETANTAERAGQTAQAAQANAIHAPEDTAPLDLDSIPDDASSQRFFKH